MSHWECPVCGERIGGCANELDYLLAKDVHADWGNCDYIGLRE